MMTVEEYEEWKSMNYMKNGNHTSFLRSSSEIIPCFNKYIPNPYTLSKECGPIIAFLSREMVC